MNHRHNKQVRHPGFSKKTHGWLAVLGFLLLSACNGERTPSASAPPLPPSTPKPETPIKKSPPVACPKDARLCPDGVTSVGRDPNNQCQFYPCPKPEAPMTEKPKQATAADKSTASGPKSQVFCPQDVRQCPDGSWVGRDPDNHCRFRPCPDGTIPDEQPGNPLE